MTRFVSAVIGCGRMGAFTSETIERTVPRFWLPLSHSAAIAAQPELTLSALCEIDPQLLARAQERFGIARGYTDYRQLIDEITPQVLGVATRTPERPAIVEYALEHGVRALHLEKPLCNSVSQLIRLERLLTRCDVICTYGTLRRYLEVYRRARDLAHSGRYGALQEVHVNFGAAKLLWTHPHSLDMLLFMAGDVDVERVSARFAEVGVDVDGAKLDGDPVVLSVLVEFANGITGLIGRGGGSDVVLSCKDGTIVVEADGYRVRYRHGDGKGPYWHIDNVDEFESNGDDGCNGGTQLAFERLVRGLRGENAARVAADKRAILMGQRLIFSCVQSHLLGGTAVDPRMLDPDLQVTGRSGDRYA